MAERWRKTLMSVAGHNDGLVCSRNAARAWVSKQRINRAVQEGILLPWLPGVYRVAGPALTRRQELLGALLWAGEGAVLSHWTAAELHQLDIPTPRTIHLSTHREIRPPSGCIVVHSRTYIYPTDVMAIDGMAVTEPKRTLIDLAAVAREGVWETALDTFLRQGMSLDDFVDRFLATAERGRNGTRMIRRLLEQRRGESGVPEQSFERKMLRFLRAHGLPAPVCQHPVQLPSGRPVRLDFAYPDLMIAIEGQSYRWHSDRRDWEGDRARLGELASLGWLVIEVTWRQLHDSPEEVAARIRRAIALRSTSVG